VARPRLRCIHQIFHADCDGCVRRAIRANCAAWVECALCEQTGHTARLCPQTSVGRVRLKGGSTKYAAPPAEVVE
jgi:hypothetical protein